MPLIQIRNVPEDVHRKLKARAAEDGRTLSDYVLEELERMAGLPTMAETRARLEALEPVRLEPGEAARIVREGREARDETLR